MTKSRNDANLNFSKKYSNYLNYLNYLGLSRAILSTCNTQDNFCFIQEPLLREERDECKFTIENRNELKKDIKTIEDAWDKIKNY